MSTSPLRWGILGTANIARKNWRSIRDSGNGNGIVTAVASREAARAEKFIAENQAAAPFTTPPRAIGSYAELVTAPDVDAIYVPLPTGLRQEWLLRAAAAGKHLVCEKPCSLSVADLRAVLDACRQHRVQFMDGVMFMHSHRLAHLRTRLDAGAIGELRRVSSAFSFRAPPDFFTGNIRAHSALEPDGCLGDLGWYCLRFSLWAVNWQLPQRVTGRLLRSLGRSDSPAPVPTEFSGELLYADGRAASFFCSFTSELHQWAHLDGTKGSLRLSDFVLPAPGVPETFELNGQPHTVGAPGACGPETAQETEQFRNFTKQVRSGALNDHWPEIALRTQQVMAACLTSARADGQPVALAHHC